MARASGRAPLLLCTSGTAPAHYLPAVIEASESALPLLVLSADRPARLVDCGAPQTIDQARLFGAHARFFAELGEPDASPAALRALRRTAARAVAEAHGPRPGPVHLNARADKPLEPRGAETDEERALEALAREIEREPVPRVSLGRLAADEEALEALARAIDAAARPAMVAGPLGLEALSSRDAVFALARTSGAALFAEAASQLRFAGARRAGVTCADAFDRWLDGAGSEALPDLVLELGATPTSSAYAQLPRAREAGALRGRREPLPRSERHRARRRAGRARRDRARAGRAGSAARDRAALRRGARERGGARLGRGGACPRDRYARGGRRARARRGAALGRAPRARQQPPPSGTSTASCRALSICGSSRSAASTASTARSRAPRAPRSPTVDRSRSCWVT
ncbi:MAG: thiamine pyrophosphate-binding protein [Sandaracinaceae bacterium]|nr:thiamine pyrophosphate-binding protein [Sandaracinaceae bacterium]